MRIEYPSIALTFVIRGGLIHSLPPRGSRPQYCLHTGMTGSSCKNNRLVICPDQSVDAVQLIVIAYWASASIVRPVGTLGGVVSTMITPSEPSV